LRELGASYELLKCGIHLDAPWGDSPHERRELEKRVRDARRALESYFREFKHNATRGNRADDGRDELRLAFLIDHDLTAILAELNREAGVQPIETGTAVYLTRHPEALALPGATPVSA